MPSTRKLTQRAKRLARRQAQTKPGGASRYALKRRRVLAGWDNPRSPIRVSGSIAALQTIAPGSYAAEDLASEILAAAEAPL